MPLRVCACEGAYLGVSVCSIAGECPCVRMCECVNVFKGVRLSARLHVDVSEFVCASVWVGARVSHVSVCKVRGCECAKVHAPVSAAAPVFVRLCDYVSPSVRVCVCLRVSI